MNNEYRISQIEYKITQQQKTIDALIDIISSTRNKQISQEEYISATLTTLNKITRELTDEIKQNQTRITALENWKISHITSIYTTNKGG